MKNKIFGKRSLIFAISIKRLRMKNDVGNYCLYPKSVKDVRYIMSLFVLDKKKDETVYLARFIITIHKSRSRQIITLVSHTYRDL